MERESGGRSDGRALERGCGRRALGWSERGAIGRRFLLWRDREQGSDPIPWELTRSGGVSLGRGSMAEERPGCLEEPAARSGRFAPATREAESSEMAERVAAVFPN